MPVLSSLHFRSPQTKCHECNPKLLAFFACSYYCPLIQITVNQKVQSFLAPKAKKMRYLRFISPHLSRDHKTPFQIPNFKFPNLSYRQFTSAPQPEQSFPPPPSPPPPPSEKVSAIVDEISGLTLLEVSDLTEVLRSKLGIKEMPVMAVMMPGMVFSGMAGMGGGGAAAEGKVEEKVEKTVFDVKLEGFDAASKIKVIKEVRSFTDLGLKEAKDLVEKAPSLVKKGVTKEEAEKFIEKMKGVGAKVLME